jgi:hypothetical protein
MVTSEEKQVLDSSNTLLIYLTPFNNLTLEKDELSTNNETSDPSSLSKPTTVCHVANVGPFCYLLEIDSARILLDAGASVLENGHDVKHLAPLKT